MDGHSENFFSTLFNKLFKKNENENVLNILLNVLNLNDVLVDEIMVPRGDIACVSYDTSLEDIAHFIVENGYSRVPIYKGTTDHIIGLVHSKDILKYCLNPDKNITLHSILRAPLFIPEASNAKDIFNLLRKKGNHLAILQDEYGGTTGIITLEDILEQIVGDISDEYDNCDNLDEDIIDGLNGTIYLTGRASINDVNEKLSTQLDSEQVDTISGYLSELAGRIPSRGEIFTIEGFTFTIDKATPRLIETIIVEKEKDATEIISQ